MRLTRFLLLTLALVALVALPMAAIGAGPAVQLFVSGKQVYPEVPPQVVGGRVLVPLRFVAEALGSHVSWDPDNRRVFVNKSQDSLEPATEDGYQKGYAAGKTAGYNLGRSDGYNEGYQVGHTAGYNEGYQKGLQEGRQGTQADTSVTYDPKSGGQRITYSSELTGPGLQIDGPQGFINVTIHALKLMREKSPDDYWFVINHLTKVRLDPGGEVEAGLGGNVDYKRICRVSNRRFLTVYDLVAIMVHEANHVWLIKNLYVFPPREEIEKSCLRREIAALRNVGAPQYLIDYKQKVHDNIKEYKWW